MQIAILNLSQTYGRLDVLIYNSGAIWWSSVENTPMKRFQLMQRVNPEGLYGAVQAALPHFKKQGWRGRIIVVSPPIYSRFFRGKTAYAMGKVGMSVLTKGLAMDFVRQGRTEMAITSIWPAAVSSPITIQSMAVLGADTVRPLIRPRPLIRRSSVSSENLYVIPLSTRLNQVGLTGFRPYSPMQSSRCWKLRRKQ